MPAVPGVGVREDAKPLHLRILGPRLRERPIQDSLSADSHTVVEETSRGRLSHDGETWTAAADRFDRVPGALLARHFALR